MSVIPKGFFPQQDTGFIFGEVDTRQDASFRSTVKTGHEVVDIVRADPASTASSRWPAPMPTTRARTRPACSSRSNPFDERTATADQVIQRLRTAVGRVAGAKFFMQVPQNITVGGRLARTQYQYTLTDTNLDELNHWAPILERAMRKLPELQDVASDAAGRRAACRDRRSTATPPRGSACPPR